MGARNRIYVVVAVLAGACDAGGGMEPIFELPAVKPDAFLFQDVAPSGNAVRVGYTTNTFTVQTTGVNVLTWQALGQARAYGDPTFSRLSNGRWAMTATTSPQDPRGGQALQYHEAQCPTVEASAVRVIPASTAATCEATGATAMAKTSQVLDRKSTRLNSSHIQKSRMPSSA